jgi:GNAT superfamily N-acetyltransferase
MTPSSVPLTISTLAARPDLAQQMWEMPEGAWPEFMLWDPVASLYFDHLVSDFSEYVLVATPPDHPDHVIARGLSVPFAFDFGNRRELPAGGWDCVIRWAHADRAEGRAPNLVSALEITIRPGLQGSGLSAAMVQAMRENAGRLGFSTLVAPVRPNRKHLEPFVPMAGYIARLRPDGLPDDPWLRVHARLGAEIVGVCPTSMTVTGTLAQWREWTNLPFDTDGEIEVPGALAPVVVRTAYDHAVYVEPNVWVRHAL